MSTTDLAQALEAWAEASSAASASPTKPEMLSDALPLVLCQVREDSEETTSPSFPEQGYQQVSMEVYAIELMVLVKAEPAWTAEQATYDIVDDLKEALRADRTLGGRVEAADRRYRVSYIGEVEYEDGTRARAAIFRITVGNRVEAS